MNQIPADTTKEKLFQEFNTVVAETDVREPRCEVRGTLPPEAILRRQHHGRLVPLFAQCLHERARDDEMPTLDEQRRRGDDDDSFHAKKDRSALSGSRRRTALVAREVVIGRSAQVYAASERESRETVPQYLEPHEVPAVVDGAWWLANQHCFDWTRDGRGVRLRRLPRRTTGA